MSDQPIGDWRFDTGSAELTKPGHQKRLEDRSARTLAFLCRHRGEVVSKADILQEVWSGRTVSPNSVAIVIADLRRALGEDARAPQYIETVGKRGYRLNQAPEAVPTPDLRQRPARARPAALVLTGLAVGIAITFVLIARAMQPASSVEIILQPVHNETGQGRYDPLAKALTALVEERLTQVPAVIAEIKAPAVGLHPQRRLDLTGRLITWNNTPTLSLAATDRVSGRVIWSGMAVGQPNTIADATISKLADLNRHL